MLQTGQTVIISGAAGTVVGEVLDARAVRDLPEIDGETHPVMLIRQWLEADGFTHAAVLGYDGVKFVAAYRESEQCWRDLRGQALQIVPVGVTAPSDKS